MRTMNATHCRIEYDAKLPKKYRWLVLKTEGENGLLASATMHPTEAAAQKAKAAFVPHQVQPISA